ncbi:MAG: hypothetical protein U0L37_01585 [Bacteroidales bacterium]|nr:hypothetical protein [Bacteroidales bacterium]
MENHLKCQEHIEWSRIKSRNATREYQAQNHGKPFIGSRWKMPIGLQWKKCYTLIDCRQGRYCESIHIKGANSII